MSAIILAGPMLRRASMERLVFWLASRTSLQFRLHFPSHPQSNIGLELTQQQLQVGEHCFIQLLDINLHHTLPSDTLIAYDLQWRTTAQQPWCSITDWAPELRYAQAAFPELVIRSRIDAVLHGSCRKPHHGAADGLVAADSWLAQRHAEPLARPALLMLSGDQIYADDVAGPMLTAIHQLIAELGLYPETLQGALVANSAELFASPLNYYRRSELLPSNQSNQRLKKRFFEGARKPIFTTSSADNHLITLAEVLAMYLLVWSPIPWQQLSEAQPALSADRQQ